MRFCLSIYLLLTLLASVTYAAPSMIVLLRHAEESDDSGRYLSEKGEIRAQKLAQFFRSREVQEKWGRPEFLFAANSSGGRSKRSIQTLEPTAEALHLTIETSYEKGDETRLMKDLFKDATFNDGVVVIAWSHKKLPKFLEYMSDVVSDLPKDWDSDTFDHFWVLKRFKNGNWKFQDIPQRLLPGDSSN